MESLDYQDLFYDALQRAFGASNPPARLAYFDLAVFYRNKLGDNLQLMPTSEQLQRISERLNPATPGSLQ